MKQPPTTSVATQALRAALWSVLGRYGHMIVSLVVMAVLTRILHPRDFGVVAMTAVLTQFVHILSDGGVSRAVVQFPEWGIREHSTMFWQSLLIGFLLYGATWVGAPWVAEYFREPALVPILRVAGFTFVLNAAARVPTGLLSRELRFREITQSELVASVLSGIVGVLMAVAGWGYWALVFREVAIFLVRLVTAWRYAGFWPQRVLDLASVREGSRFGRDASGFLAINYWARTADNLFIGRFLGAEPLAYYSRAYALMAYPMELLTGAVAPVLHPALARAREDVGQMRGAWLQVVHVIALVSMPLMFSLVHVAESAVLVMWGPSWGPSVPAFRWLCVLGGIQPWIATVGSVFLARGRARAQLGFGIVTSAILVATFWVTAPLGIEVLAQAYVVAWLAPMPVLVGYVLTNVMEGRPRELGAALAFPVLVTAVCSGAAWSVATLLPPMSSLAELLLVGAPAAGTWIAMNAVFHRTWWRTQWRTLRS
jgi:PST family polysaccharide transporter